MKSIQTESSVTIEQDTERRQSQLFRKVIELWPLIVVAIGGIVTAITFWNNVNGLVADQKTFKATVDARKEIHQKEMEQVHVDIAEMKKDIEWLKKTK